MGRQGEHQLQVAEFFAGIGLMRLGLETGGPWKTVWSNDIDARKREMYVRQFGPEGFVLKDIADAGGADLPRIDLATASFPCVDLSLAGYRHGLDGLRSGTLWHFLRILKELRGRRPQLILIENVVGFATSKAGEDLVATIRALNDLGYTCDPFVVDAVHFVPQSRPRLFLVGVLGGIGVPDDANDSPFRPESVRRLVRQHADLQTHSWHLTLPTRPAPNLRSIVEPLAPEDPRWWSPERVAKFKQSMAARHLARLEALVVADEVSWGTAYRRTRDSVPRAELRVDGTAGCLRAMRGGSSRQILVQAGRGDLAVRFMLPVEYARLMGAPHFDLSGLPEHQALFGFGDAVCVPVVAWLTAHYLTPLARRNTSEPLRMPEAAASS